MALNGSIVITTQVDTGQSQQALAQLIQRVEGLERTQRSASASLSDATQEARENYALQLRSIRATGGGYEELRRAAEQYVHMLRRAGASTNELRDAELRVTEIDFAENMRRQAERTEALTRAMNVASIAVAAVAAAMTAATIGSIKLAAELEQSNVAFTTMLGSGEKAKKFLDDLAAFAAATPFEFRDLQDSSKKLLAFGFAAQDIIPIMNSVGGAVAGLGGGKAEIDRVTMALGQMQAKGKVSAEEMNQLAELGIPGWEMISKAIGKSIPESMKLAEKGAIDSTTAINALVTGMGDKFPGMLKKQSETLNGQLSNLVDGVTQTATLIGQRLIDAFNIKEAVGAAAQAVAGFAAIIKQEGLRKALDEAFPPGLQVIIMGVAGALTGALVAGAVAATTAMQPLIASTWAAIGPYVILGATIAGAAAIIIKNWKPISGFMKGIFETIAGYMDGLRKGTMATFGGMFKWIRETMQKIIDFLRPKVEAIVAALPEPMRAGLDKMLGFLRDKGKDIATGTGEAFQSAVSMVGSGVKRAADVAGGAIKTVSDLFVPHMEKIRNASKVAGVDTAFTGLHGKPPAPAVPTAAGAAAAKAAATKAEKEERERVKAHAKAISKIVTLPDTATPKEGGRFKAQTEDLELARKKATAANNDFLASQVEVDIINRKVTATEANLGKATTERAQAQAELSRLQNLTTVMTPADEKEYKKRVSELTNFVKQRDKEVSDYRADLNDLEFERQVFIQERIANAIRSAYSLAFRLISGDFQSIFTDAATMIGSYVVNALSNNPAIQTAIDGVTKSVGDTVSKMVSGLVGGGLDAAGAAVAGGLPAIMSSFSALGAALAPLLPIVALVVAAFAVFYEAWNQNVAYIQENFAALGQAVGYLWGTIMDGLQPVIDIVGSALSALAGPLTLVAFVADTVISAFTGVFKAVWDAINAFAPLKWIVDGISWVFNGVIDAVLAVVNWFRRLPFVNQPELTRDKTTGAIGMAPPAAGAPTEVGDYVFQDGKWVRKASSGQYDRVRGPSGAFEFKPKEIKAPETKPAAMPGETPDKPIYTQVVNVRDFREAFPDSAYFRAPSVDTTRSLNANAVAYR